MMIHEQIDLERWIDEFPIDRLRQEAREYVLARKQKAPSEYPTQQAVDDHIKLMIPGGEIITSPSHLAIVEQLRQEAFADHSDIQTVPADIFVFAKGTADKRAVTCIGGVPYWPAGKSWPASRTGKPLSFVAQFCFLDSIDIVGKLPGDLLLIFANGIASDSDALHFEWIRLTDEALVSEQEVPQTQWHVLPCFGHIHRTVDYVDAYDVVVDRYSSPYCIDTMQGTKIGGRPAWIQGDENLKGRHLCTLGSIHPAVEVPWPFLNHPEPYSGYTYMEETEGALMFGDVGMLYISIDDSGELDWTEQCY